MDGILYHMTPHERKEVRNEFLISYFDAVDDRKAHCGQLLKVVGVLRTVVTAHSAGELSVSDDGLVAGHTLPTHAALVKAFTECQQARQRELIAYTEAINAGVDRSRLDPPGAEEKPPVSISVAGSLA